MLVEILYIDTVLFQLFTFFKTLFQIFAFANDLFISENAQFYLFNPPEVIVTKFHFQK